MAAVLGVATREEDGRGDLLHSQVPDVSQGTPTSGTAVQLRLAVLTDKVAAGALQKRTVSGESFESGHSLRTWQLRKTLWQTKVQSFAERL